MGIGKITGIVIVIVLVVFFILFFIGRGTQASTATITWGNVTVYSDYSPPYLLLPEGDVWQILPNHYEEVDVYCTSGSCNGTFTVAGSFQSSTPVFLYILNASQYADYISNGNLTTYYYTTGKVTRGAMDINLKIGHYYITVINP